MKPLLTKEALIDIFADQIKKPKVVGRLYYIYSVIDKYNSMGATYEFPEIDLKVNMVPIEDIESLKDLWFVAKNKINDVPELAANEETWKLRGGRDD